MVKERSDAELTEAIKSAAAALNKAADEAAASGLRVVMEITEVRTIGNPVCDRVDVTVMRLL